MEPLQAGDPRYVGAYRLTARLGAGGMGRVFLGVSPGGRRVAVKLMHPEHSADSEFRQRFAGEVAAARRVGGFHTAPVVDAAPAADPPWMVTAYIPGPSLAEVIKRTGPLDPAALRALAAGLAEGLKAVHAAGLIHRDLKPSNVIMAEDGPRIIDFGVARALDAAPLTSSGVLIGTFSFMSPEQVRGERVGPESDVFSLGSVLAYAATGHGPFDSPSIPAIIHRIATGPPDLGSVSDPLRGVISACLAKNPADRPALDQLLSFLSGAPGQPPSSWPTPVTAAPGVSPPATATVPPHLPTQTSGGNSGRSPLRRVAAFGGALAAVVAVVLGVYFGTHGGAGTPGGAHTQTSAPATLARSHPASQSPGTSSAPASTAAAPTSSPASSGGSTSAGPATGTTVCTTPAVACTGSNATALQTEPAGITNSADGATYIKGLVWTGWGTATATGTGTMEADNCIPNCAQGHDAAYSATVTLTDLVPYGNGEQAYSVMAISVPAAPSRSETFSTHLVP